MWSPEGPEGGCKARTVFSSCWCWLRICIRFTWTGMGTTILGLLFGEESEYGALLVGLICCVVPRLCTMPALTRFHFARRFWNQILTCTSLNLSWCAIWERSVRERYFFEWNSFSSSRSCSLVNAVLRRRDDLLAAEEFCPSAAVPPLPPPLPPESILSPPPPFAIGDFSQSSSSSSSRLESGSSSSASDEVLSTSGPAGKRRKMGC